MNSYRARFRFIVCVAFFVTNFFAIPGIFAPIRVVELMGATPPQEGVWAAFGFLLSVLVSLFSIPVFLDVQRYTFNAAVGALAHIALFAYWFFLYRQQTGDGTPWIAWLELVVGVVELYLLPSVMNECLQRPSE